MDSLTFCSSNLTVLTELDLGDAPAGSSDDYALRIMNNSDLYQAEDVTVTATGDDAIQLWLSVDDDSFTASINIGDIAPHSASEVFWLRRVTATTDSGSGNASLSAVPASWSPPIDTATSDNVALEEA